MSKLTNAQKVNSIRAQIQELRQLGCSSMAVEVERDLDRIIATASETACSALV
jgi:hypothetical protein